MANRLMNIPQRETAGSSTFLRYDYQYYWAFFTLMERIRSDQNYDPDVGVLIEYHEDVILIENVSSRNQFRFYQIKAYQDGLSISKIIEGKDINSMISKMNLSSEFITVLDDILSIELVSANGFKFEKNQFKNNNRLQFYKLSEDTQNKILSCISNTETKDKFLNRFYLHQSNLKQDDFEKLVMAKLVEIIGILHPNCKVNILSIRDTIINNLHHKGKNIINTNSNDINLIEQKGLCCKEILKIIKSNTDIYKDTLELCNSIIEKLNLIVSDSLLIKKNLKEYEVYALDASKIQSIIKNDILNDNIIDKIKSSTSISNDELYNKINTYTDKLYDSYEDNDKFEELKFIIKAAIIYEYVNSINTRVEPNISKLIRRKR